MPDYRQTPDDYKQILITLLTELSKVKSGNPKKIPRLIYDFKNKSGSILSKGDLNTAYRKLKAEKSIKLKAGAEQILLSNIQMKKVRTISGVTPITVFTKPYPCPGKCIFCPTEFRMPKSYLSHEPGVQRAVRNNFDPYLQVINRLQALNSIGHPVAKVELIVLGGTWSAYPRDYRIWFIKRLFDALNSFPVIMAIRDSTQKATLKGLYKTHRLNETGPVRAVGLSVETRPDEITAREVIFLRRLGTTKVQIGIQSLNDTVLAKNKRGHDTRCTTRAISLLRRAGFKIMAHYMPNLYGSTPDRDIRDYKKMFTDIRFRPDELKVYPCSLIKSAELYKYYLQDKWKPYTHAQLYRVLKASYLATPNYCRISRMVRDIPKEYIVEGSEVSNFRQILESDFGKSGIQPREIRSREIGLEKYRSEDRKLITTVYKTPVSREYFLEYTTPANRIIGFLRLSLPTQEAITAELDGSALIREVHIYGPSQRIGDSSGHYSQHRGLGSGLINHAQKLAINYKFRKISVISAVGTREYYRKLGFTDGNLYQHKQLF